MNLEEEMEEEARKFSSRQIKETLIPGYSIYIGIKEPNGFGEFFPVFDKMVRIGWDLAKLTAYGYLGYQIGKGINLF
jgi:hypothetical protein